MYVPVCGGRNVAVDVSCGVSHSTVTEGRMWPGRAGDVFSLNFRLPENAEKSLLLACGNILHASAKRQQCNQYGLILLLPIVMCS
jgi:hypothetical protein